MTRRGGQCRDGVRLVHGAAWAMPSDSYQQRFFGDGLLLLLEDRWVLLVLSTHLLLLRHGDVWLNMCST